MAKAPLKSALYYRNLAPRPTRFEEHDDGVKGLRLAVQPSGHKSWVVRYSVDKRERKYTLGEFDRVGLGDARKLAADVLLKVAAGKDPQGEKIVARRKAVAGLDKEQTLGAVYERYLRWARDVRQMRPKSIQNIESIFKLVYLPKFARRPLPDVTPAEVLRAVDNAGDRAHAYAVGKAFFNWALGKLLIDRSPMAGLEHPAKGKPQRDRVLTADEIKTLWKAADEMAYPFGPMAKLLLLTGARLREVSEMHRSEIDFDKREWKLPADRVKNGREHIVHLSDVALDVLKALPKIGDKPGLCFTTTGESPVSGFSRAKRIFDRKMTGVPAWTFHDLRRTCATGMGELGVPVVVIEAALNHVSGVRGGLVGRYQHQSYAKERREAFDQWGAHVAALVKGESVPLVPEQAEAVPA
jgi:integrase